MPLFVLSLGISVLLHYALFSPFSIQIHVSLDHVNSLLGLESLSNCDSDQLYVRLSSIKQFLYAISGLLCLIKMKIICDSS